MPEPNPRLTKHLAARFSGLDGWGLLGPLERQLMAALWTQSPVTLLDLHRRFPAKPYRTLVGTLDRLYKKGLVRRERVTRANAYSPTMSRQELAAAIAGSIIMPRT